jgi:hypothetical protein
MSFPDGVALNVAVKVPVCPVNAVLLHELLAG